MAAPPRDPATPLDDEDVAPSSRPRPVAASDAAPPPSGRTLFDGRVALWRFLASPDDKEGAHYIRGVIFKKLGQPLDDDLVEDLVQSASAAALAAKSPPLFSWGVSAWVARLTRRTIAAYFEAKKEDVEFLERGADAAIQPGERHGPATDWEARAHLITKWMEGQIGQNPTKVQTFRLMCEHELHGKSLRELATEHQTTSSALSNRFHKLRAELAPKVSVMDKEKPRRTLLFILLTIALGIAVALLLWLLRPAPEPRAVPEVPLVHSAPSASAVVLPPVFNQAVSAPTPEPDTPGKPAQPAPRP